MTAFDHLADGTDEAAWQDGALDSLAPVSASSAHLVVLAAHPDDETLGAGGLIAAAGRLGAAIDVVVASDGEASHPRSPTHSSVQLASIRRREVRAAVARLAPHATVHHLGLPDGDITSHGEAVVAGLRSVLGDAPTRLVSPWLEDRHPDHEACARAAGEVASASPSVEHWQYPIWWWHWGDPSADRPDGLCRLELEAADHAAKNAALDEHVSQHAPLSPQAGDEAILPPRVRAHFERAYECFVVPTAPASQSSYFDALYAGSPDPWGLADRFYEKRKRDLIMASLPCARFARVFEPGCATGLLTVRLAERADDVVAWDVADAALEQAATRVDPSRVELRRGRIPQDWPVGEFDLIVVSEIGYYCDDLGRLARRVQDSLAPGGHVLGCHWVREARDHPRSGAEVHAAIDRVLARVVHHVEDDFVLDVWGRDGRSVASREGIV